MRCYKFTTALLIFLSIYGLANADELFFYKYYEGNGKYKTFFFDRESINSEQFHIGVVASKLFHRNFFIEQLKKKYYNVVEVDNIVFMGQTIKQYILSPKNKDRFKHVLWLRGRHLVKTEVYDVDDNLVIAYGKIDLSYGTENHMDAIITNPKVSNRSRGSSHNFYKGFDHVRTKQLPENRYHIFFSDGLNGVSIFIDETPVKSDMNAKTVYGNMFLSKIINGIEYSAMGTLPYSALLEFIDKIGNSEDKIYKELINCSHAMDSVTPSDEK